MFRSKLSACRLAALTLGVTLSLAAGAQGPRERPRYVLQALDLDHDNVLSASEMQSASATLSSLDRNRDGQLTPDELEPPRPDAGASPDQLVTQLMSFDKNGDGLLTSDELPERMQALFARGDANNDGKLTPEEIRHLAAHTGGPNGRPTGAGKAGGMMRLDPILNALDADHDGTLSASEIQAASTALAVLDLNHDGSVEPAEMRVRQQTPAERAAHVLDEFDTNHDGKLSQADLPDGLRPRFSGADTNGDGLLDSNELLQMFTTMQQQAPAGGAPGAAPAAADQTKGH